MRNLQVNIRLASWISSSLVIVFVSLAITQERSEPKMAAMPISRHMFVAVSINGHIYCIGGNNASDDPIATLHGYDVAKNTWVEKAKWPTPSTYPCGAAANGKLYIIGGPTGKDPKTSVVERYDPQTDTWKRLADLPVARSHSVAVAKGDALYVIGGHGRVEDPDSSQL
jgi:hypothetical protein